MHWGNLKQEKKGCQCVLDGNKGTIHLRERVRRPSVAPFSAQLVTTLITTFTVHNTPALGRGSRPTDTDSTGYTPRISGSVVSLWTPAPAGSGCASTLKIRILSKSLVSFRLTAQTSVPGWCSLWTLQSILRFTSN